MFGSRRRRQQREAAARAAPASEPVVPAPAPAAVEPEWGADLASGASLATRPDTRPERVVDAVPPDVLPRIEQALMAIAAHASRLDARLDALERRLDTGLDTLDHVATRADVDELRHRLTDAAGAIQAELARLEPPPPPEPERVAPLFAPIPIPPRNGAERS